MASASSLARRRIPANIFLDNESLVLYILPL